MCGIFGFTHFRGTSDQAMDLLRQGSAAIAHRGPDDSGVEFFENDRVGLAHRRLSILDVSDRGHQPMVSQSGRYWISYNGEVYNFRQLRTELEGSYSFKTECDTEVMLAAFEKWGVVSSIGRFRGMFAFAVFDLFEKQLFLVRDRMGIKPLYYGASDGTFWFASELRALAMPGSMPFEVNPASLESFFAFNFVLGDESMINGVHRLNPGHYLRISTSNPMSFKIVEYWNASNRKTENQSDLLPEEWLERVRNKLLEAVKLRMVADVPLGAFLSGGIDSSLIVAVMQQLSDRPVKTFTIRTEEGDYDESAHAAKVAQQLGTEHHCFTITHQKVLDSIERAGAIFDEPMADVSIIPSLLVSEEARKQVTVALTGDGGDEVFGGYNRYFQTPRILRRMSLIPGGAKRVLGKLMAQRQTEQFLKHSGILGRFVAGAEKMQKVRRLMLAESPEEIYYQLIIRNGSFANSSLLERILPEFRQISMDAEGSLARKLMRYDVSCYLRYDILPKLDIGSMRPSLEARVPFLDHELYELSLEIPDSLLMTGGTGKLMLRRMLGEFVDPKLFERPKMGFGIPMAYWLRTELKDWARQRLFDSGNPEVLERKQMETLWKQHLQSEQREDSGIWPLLLFFSWYESMRK